MNAASATSLRVLSASVAAIVFFSTAGFGECTEAHEIYRSGLAAYKHEEWDAAAERMQSAVAICTEAGGLIRTHGNWYEPYLPNFYLGASLYQLGCWSTAKRHLEESVLNYEIIRRAKNQHRELASLLFECELLVRQEAPEPSSCERWQQSPTTPAPPASNPPDENN